jgi:hypothetical protein
MRLDPNVLPDPSEIIERHMAHAMHCDCLGASGLCCRSLCPCKIEGYLQSAAGGILGEVMNELDRAVKKHGPQLTVPMFDLPVGKIVASGHDAKRSCQIAFETGRGSWADILLEEVAEAMDETNDPEALRQELIQAAAMAVAMVRALDYQRDN